MTTDLSFVGLEQLWEEAGGNPTWAPTAAAVALAESGGNPDAQNLSDPAGGSFGPWQINGVHAPGGEASAAWIASIENPLTNAEEAVTVSGNGTNWRPWEEDPVAKAVIAGGNQPLSVAQAEAMEGTGGTATPATLTSATTPAQATLTGYDWNPLNLFGIPGTVIGGVATQSAKDFGTVFGTIFGAFWDDAKTYILTGAFIAGGIALVVVGLKDSAEPEGGGSPVRDAAEVAAVGAMAA